LLAGIGRTWIEFFRPDQPKIGESDISYSMIVAALMAITGAVMLLARYKALNLQAAEEWEEEYQISRKPMPAKALLRRSRILGGRNEIPAKSLRGRATTKVKTSPGTKWVAANVKPAAVKKTSMRKPAAKSTVSTTKATPQKKKSTTKKTASPRKKTSS